MKIKEKNIPGIGNIEFTGTLNDTISEDLEQLHQPIPKGWRQIIKEQKEDPNYTPPPPFTLEEIYNQLMEIYVNRYKDVPPELNIFQKPLFPDEMYFDKDTTAGDSNFGKSITT